VLSLFSTIRFFMFHLNNLLLIGRNNKDGKMAFRFLDDGRFLW